MADNSIKLLVVDDHQVIRAGLEAILAETEIQIIAQAETAADALQLATQLEPDIVLLDIRLADSNGLDALGRIRIERPRMPIVMFSAFNNPPWIARAVALGANGFLVKSVGHDEMLATIRKAAAGENTFSPELLRRVTGALATPRAANDTEVPLTQREFEVLKHMAGGHTNKEIAKMLHISYETVKEHVQHILRKIGVNDRTQAAVWAVRQELV